MDDDRDTLDLLKRALEENGYTVHAFDSPVKVLEFIMTTNSPQLLISDIRMSDLSGFELVRKTKARHPEMKIILLTAFEMDRSEFEKVFPSTPVDALLDKPIRISKLIDAVNTVIGSQRTDVRRERVDH